jgi:hypothetical protein
MILLAVFAPCAHANSIPTFNVFQAVIPIFTNFGGDNEFFFFTGSGISLAGGGTAVCGWCNSGTPLLAGSSLNPSVSITTFDFISGGTASIGGHNYNLSGGFLFDSSITALSSFTFPTNGQATFTARVSAVLNGPILGFATSLPFPEEFNLQIPTTGTLVLTFTFSPGQNGQPGSYFYSGGQFSVLPTPEPGTLAMVGSGLCGIAGMVGRKLKMRLSGRQNFHSCGGRE